MRRPCVLAWSETQALFLKIITHYYEFGQVLSKNIFCGLYCENDCFELCCYELGFFLYNFKLDENLVNKTAGLTIFNSKDDDREIQDTVKKIQNEVKNIKVTEFENMGHFCHKHMKTDAFPELLEEFN